MADGAPGKLSSWSLTDPYRTWPPHPDGHVEDLFRQANRDDFVFVHLAGMYTLISPDGTQEMQFQDYVVP